MAVRQYVGARYVPKFYEFNNGVWESNTEYEPLTIVQYNGNSYTSKKQVSANVGNPSSNSDYWAATGNYNAQVEAYRQDVQNLNAKIDGVVDDVADLETKHDKEIKIQLNHLANKSIAIFGDSISIGYEGGVPWTTKFGKDLTPYNVSIDNYAVGGNTIALTTPIVNNTNLNKYDLIILAIGTNNIGGSVNDTRTDIIALKNAFNGYNGELYVFTPFYRNDVIGNNYITITHIGNMLYNAFSPIAKVIQGYNAGKLPLIDGLHPTTAGSEMLCNFIEQQLFNQTSDYQMVNFGYYKLPVTVSTNNGTVTKAQGYISDLTNSSVILSVSIQCVQGRNYVNLDFGASANSWLLNSFIWTFNGYVLDNANAPIPANMVTVGTTYQIVFDAPDTSDRHFELKYDIPNQLIFE